MRTLVEIAKDIRAVQHTMYRAELDSWDGLEPDRTEREHNISQLMNEFARTLGYIELDEFTNSQHIILDTIQKYLDNKSLEDHYFELQDYIEYDEAPTIEGLQKLINDRVFY